MPVNLYDKLIKAFTGNTGLVDANAVEVDATGFDGNLATSDVNVQLVAQKLDDLTLITPTPSLHNFSIDIPSRVNLNTDLNVQHTVTFSVTNHSHLTALTLIVTTGDNKTLTTPIIDGQQSQTVTLSGISTASAGNVTFQLSGTHSGGTALSNVVTVNIADLQSHEFAYFGVRPTNDFASVATSALSSADVSSSGTVYTISVSVPNGSFLGILSPENRDPTSIIETTLNTESITDFTAAPGNPVRVINSVNYNLLTIQNNSGFTGTFNFRVTTE